MMPHTPVPCIENGHGEVGASTQGPHHCSWAPYPLPNNDLRGLLQGWDVSMPCWRGWGCFGRYGMKPSSIAHCASRRAAAAGGDYHHNAGVGFTRSQQEEKDGKGEEEGEDGRVEDEGLEPEEHGDAPPKGKLQ